MGYTNRDLCNVLFDKERGHLTVDDIVALFDTDREHVERFYQRLVRARLVEQVGRSERVSIEPLVDAPDELLAGARAEDVDLNARLPSQK